MQRTRSYSHEPAANMLFDLLETAPAKEDLAAVLRDTLKVENGKQIIENTKQLVSAKYLELKLDQWRECSALPPWPDNQEDIETINDINSQKNAIDIKYKSPLDRCTLIMSQLSAAENKVSTLCNVANMAYFTYQSLTTCTEKHERKKQIRSCLKLDNGVQVLNDVIKLMTAKRRMIRFRLWKEKLPFNDPELISLREISQKISGLLPKRYDPRILAYHDHERITDTRPAKKNRV